MRILVLVFLFVLFASTTWAQSTTILPQYNVSPGVNQSVGTATPLPVGVYAGASATSGYVLTSNGPGALATFQAGGSGSGTINSGTQYQLGYYAATGAAISGIATITTDASNDLVLANTSSTAFSVGQNGATNPALSVDTSTASSVTGVAIKSAVTGGTTTITATDSGANGTVQLNSKGAGNADVNGGSTGSVILQTQNTNRVQVNGIQIIFTPQASTNGSQSANARFLYTASADTNMATSAEAPLINFNLAANTRTHNTGALALQRDFTIYGATDAFSGASTLTDGASLAVILKNAGTNATITNSSGLLIQNQTLTGTITNSYGINVVAASGATNNYAAQFNGGVVLLNQTTGTNADFLCLSSAGLILIQSSSCTISKRDFKEVIHEVRASDAINDILAMKPTYFKFKQTDPPNPDPNFTKPQYGFIAEDMAAIDPGFTIYENDGKTPKSWDERRVVPLTVKMLQIHDEEIKQLSKGLPASHRNWFGRLMDYLESAS